VNVPTIGIGAGSYCDGQILVINDMLGLFTDFKPKFLKYFADVGSSVRIALESYKNEVEKGLYPDKEHSYDFPQQDLDEINKWFESVEIEEESNKIQE
jgi:3-methyl-2-oxobutanoate hydroxymethyltransferase